MDLRKTVGKALVASAFALSPALATHPGQDADEATEQSSDSDHEKCNHHSDSEDADHKGDVEHDHDKSVEADGHQHHCEDDASPK